MGNSLFIKNLSGSFNDQHIGHEVINLFRDDNGKQFFYIPPYGSIGSIKKDFYGSDVYKSIDKIFVFEDVGITNIFKLKHIVLNPGKFSSFEEMKAKIDQVFYRNKKLIDIDFGDQGFLTNNNKSPINDLKEEQMKVYLLSFDLTNSSIYSFEDDEIFIYVNSPEKRNNLKKRSQNLFRFIYGNNATLYEVNIIVGQKQYLYKELSALDKWYDDHIHSLCTVNRIKSFPEVPDSFSSAYEYDDDNFLAFVRKTNDENYYSNYLNGVLNANEQLLKLFFEFLVSKIRNQEQYSACDPKCYIQTQSMTPDMKIINKILKFRLESDKETTLRECEKEIKKLKKIFGYSDSTINSYISDELTPEHIKQTIFIDGQMDLYLFDDNYRIVIENKILSGLNGKHEEVSEDINQLVTYSKFLSHLDGFERPKNNNVLILCPFCVKSNFSNYKILEHPVPVITYKDLAGFFRDNRSLIVEKYRDDFIKTINRQAMTKEELITYRFVKTIIG